MTIEMIEIPVVCDVFNGETFVGTLTRHPGHDHMTSFEYDALYDGPTLHASLPKNGGKTDHQGLHPFFSNLISEGWLEESQKQVVQYRGKNHIGTETSIAIPSNFDVLAYFGSDCIGAIRVLPRKGLPEEVLTSLIGISGLLANTIDALVPGFQPKLLAVKDPQGNYCVSTREKRSTHIAKLPHKGYLLQGILEDELVTTEVVRVLLPKDDISRIELSSINVPNQFPERETHVFEEHMGLMVSTSEYNKSTPTINLAPALLIERFDRTADGECLEFYEFNQLLNKTTEEKYDGSYGDMANYIRAHARGTCVDGIKTNAADIEVLFRRILAAILVENADTHFKNFALIRRGEEFRLSPNYDLVSCAKYRENKYSFMALAIGRDRNNRAYLPDLRAKDIVALAADFGILSSEPTREEVSRLTEIIDEIGTQLKQLLVALNGSHQDEQYATLLSMKKNKTLSNELDRVSRTIEKRWNKTFSGIGVYLNKKILQRTPPTPAAPKGLDSESTTMRCNAG